MTAATACPDAETLRQLAVGATPEPLSDVLARHLQACDGCARIFDALVDPLIDILRRPAVTGSGGAEERGVAERAKRLVAAADSTVPESAGAELAADPAAGDTQEYAPRRLGKFLLHSELGAGGMGVVYRARDTLLHREVALKVIRPGGTQEMSGAQRTRFLREARAAAGLRHEHVVTVFEVGEVEGTPFLVMPLLDGENLADHLRRVGALPAADVCRLGAQVADGLAAAHAAHLIHRDIKPTNIWVEPRRGGWVQLLDFGLVKPLDDPGEALTASCGLAGTPPYMSPEQADAGVVDARSDLFSLGCVLYEMAAGVPLFRNAEGLPPVLTQVRHFRPPTGKSLLPGVHPGLAAVVAGLLQPSPAARTASATEAARQLRELPHDAPVPVPSPQRRRAKLVTAVGLTLFAALAVVAFQIVVRVKKDAADPGVTVAAPPNSRVAVDASGNVTVTLPSTPTHAVKPASPAGNGLDSAAYLPFSPNTRREVTDFVEVHGVTPDELVTWGAALPAGTVPILLGRHATGRDPLLVHAVAVTLAGDAPAVTVALSNWDVNPIPANWILQSVFFDDPKRDWLGLVLSTTDDSARYRYTTPVKDFESKVVEMRTRHYRPQAIVPDPWSDHADTISYWVKDGGRDRWVVKPSLTADELDEFVTECVRTDQCVVNAAAFLNEKSEVRFAAIGFENPERRDWDFLRDLDAAAYAVELTRHKADGFMPTSVTSYGDAKAPLYAAAWLRYNPRAKSPSDGVPWDKLAVPLPVAVADRPLESSAYVPLNEQTKREITDFSVLLDATPEAVCQWAKTLPADFVPISLGAHASARPLQAHAVAVKLTNAPPVSRPVWTRDRLPEVRYEARAGDGWRTIQHLPFESPEQGSEALYFGSRDPALYWYGWESKADWPAKVKAMREVQKCKPYVLNPSQHGTNDTLHYFMDQNGRDKWRVETDVTRDKLAALAAECVRQHLYVSLVTAYLDAPGNLRFGLIAWENPDGRDTAFRTEMTRPELLQELADRKRRGFWPVTVTSFGDPTNPRYATSWVRYDAKK